MRFDFEKNKVEINWWRGQTVTFDWQLNVRVCEDVTKTKHWKKCEVNFKDNTFFSRPFQKQLARVYDKKCETKEKKANKMFTVFFVEFILESIFV